MKYQIKNIWRANVIGTVKTHDSILVFSNDSKMDECYFKLRDFIDKFIFLYANKEKNKLILFTAHVK